MRLTHIVGSARHHFVGPRENRLASAEKLLRLIVCRVLRMHARGVVSGINNNRISRGFHWAASGEISLPGPEILAGALQDPVAVALVIAWIAGVPLFDNQMASAAPLGATATITWPTDVSLPDRITRDDHVLLLMVPLTASACDVGYVMDS